MTADVMVPPDRKHEIIRATQGTLPRVRPGIALEGLPGPQDHVRVEEGFRDRTAVALPAGLAAAVGEVFVSHIVEHEMQGPELEGLADGNGIVAVPRGGL